jgi:hypothetical protein
MESGIDANWQICFISDLTGFCCVISIAVRYSNIRFNDTRQSQKARMSCDAIFSLSHKFTN